jgi:hypothetical protein
LKASLAARYEEEGGGRRRKDIQFSLLLKFLDGKKYHTKLK